MQQRAGELRLDSTHGHTVSNAPISSSFDESGVRTVLEREADDRAGKRKALAKKAEVSTATAEVLIKSEALVECWDVEHNSLSTIPASHAKQLYDTRKPLLVAKSTKEHFQIAFPLCPDNLITLLQFNALKAMAVNKSLITGAHVLPLDCDEEIIHLTPWPARPDLLPPTLLPTELQLTVPHGNWIDIWPSPEGRDRLIRAAGTFDEDELWDDCIGGLYDGFPDDEIQRRGMVAWSPPWDLSGWEMSEGFLRKWGWMIRGIPDILEATNRWRMKRGEEPLVDD